MAEDTDPEDPFRRRDTRSVWGKSERRESPRARVQATVVVSGEPKPLDVEVSVSLNGLFIENVDAFGRATDWIGKKGTVDLHLPQPGAAKETVQLSGVFERPHHRDDGALIRASDLDFESERSLARFLDETSAV